MHAVLSTATLSAMTKSSAVAALHDEGEERRDAESDLTSAGRKDEMFCILLVINMSALHTVNEFYAFYTYIVKCLCTYVVFFNRFNKYLNSFFLTVISPF